ncbi:diversity-generating retroelement protein Avd [Endozoicomonas sp. Mp262]|uniref:diversity-generating retroelement protein Avd n=1 Tax=Endozoicomonas sp. Mp262 TaxID=2919499 RepID=UPI0021DB235A
MSEFILLQKCQDMTAYGYTALRHYPKHERHTLCAEIREAMLELVKLVIRCGKRHHKKTTLADMDIHTEFLRTLLRLSVDLKYLPIKKYEIWSKHLHEIGCIIGSWMQNERRRH